MNAPLGLREELGLERAALAELEHEASAAWERGAYGLALEARRDAAQARARVRELEAALQPPAHA